MPIYRWYFRFVFSLILCFNKCLLYFMLTILVSKVVLNWHAYTVIKTICIIYIPNIWTMKVIYMMKHVGYCRLSKQYRWMVRHCKAENCTTNGVNLIPKSRKSLEYPILVLNITFSTLENDRIDSNSTLSSSEISFDCKCLIFLHFVSIRRSNLGESIKKQVCFVENK